MEITQTNFTFFIPTKIEFGIDKFNQLADYAGPLGKKAMLVSYKDKSLEELISTCHTMLKEKGIEVVPYEEIIENPTYQVVDHGAALARKEKCDLVIGLGGGSVIDAAKGIAVCAVEENASIWEYVEGRQITRDPLPLIVIPTTAGTGSEVTQYAVISNHEQKRKEGFGKPQFYPKLAVLDPELTITLPPKATAITGVDALSHAIEGYTTRYTNGLTDALAERAIGLIAQNIQAVYKDGNNIEARSSMMMGSMMAGIVITHTDTSLAHVIGEAMGAIFNINHGLSVGLSLAAVMEYNLQTNLEKFATIARLLGGKTQNLTLNSAARMAPQLYRKLLSDLQLPAGLSTLGVFECEDVLRLCTRPGWDAANMRPADKEDFIDLIRASLDPCMSYWDRNPNYT
jgi:alcohol dehydrogenase class IV